MDNNAKYDLIENYIANDMTPVEREQFEQDAELMEATKLHEALAETLKGEKIHAFRNALNAVDSQWENPAKTKPSAKFIPLKIKRLLAVAASVALLVLAWHFFHPASPQTLFSDNFQPYQMVLNQRSVGEGSAEKTALENTAIKRYAANDFANAAISFRQLMATEPDNIAYQFYYAMSLLGSGEANNAIPVFEKIMDTPGHLFMEQSRWYLSLAYLKNGEKEAAISSFKFIQAGQYNFTEKEQLLQELQ
ncbi:MAG: hypothetical protein GC192_01220 [Bacteroidetes bacterium]|nr:hypothetical protein [Bacteroidota bacterium]